MEPKEKPKKNQAQPNETPIEAQNKTRLERIHEAIIKRDSTRAAADAAKEEYDALASSIAEDLVKNHKGSIVVIGGVKYAPKLASKRKVKIDGVETEKLPKYPYMLVAQHERDAVDIG